MQDAFNLAWKIAFASRATPARVCSIRTRTSGRRSGSRSWPVPTSPGRTTPALREWFDHDTRRPGHRRSDQAQGPHARRRRAARAALRGAGAEEHRVQRPRRRAQPALRPRPPSCPTPPSVRRSGPATRELYLQATTRPGAKLPHAWLVGTDGRRISTLDVTGKGQMTLLTGLAGAAWATPPTSSTCRSCRPSSSANPAPPTRTATGSRSARSPKPAPSWSAPTATSRGDTTPRSGTSTRPPPCSRRPVRGPRPHRRPHRRAPRDAPQYSTRRSTSPSLPRPDPTA